MLRKLNSNKAQSIMGEYALVFLLVVSMMTAMTVFVKRAVQAKYLDARNTMVGIVARNVNQVYNGKLYFEYEPYYVDAESNSQTFSVTHEFYRPGKETGKFFKGYSGIDDVVTESFATTAAPKDAD